jgi:hypothetical protein
MPLWLLNSVAQEDEFVVHQCLISMQGSNLTTFLPTPHLSSFSTPSALTISSDVTLII